MTKLIVKGGRVVMSEQVPTIGRIVHYRLDANDVVQINQRRTNSKSIADRLISGVPSVEGKAVSVYAWPAGAQAHIGNEAHEGDAFPMLIVKIWGTTPTSSVNGQVFLDGNDVLWATSVSVGDGPHSWSWPAR
jgi:hypothetical protein